MMGIFLMVIIFEFKEGGRVGRFKVVKFFFRFVEGFEDKQFRIGSIVMLFVVVEVMLEVEITWYKDGKEIGYSGEYYFVCLK